MAELKAQLDHTVANGEHPHELPRQPPLRALPVIVRDDVVVYAVFVQIKRVLVVLYVTSVDRPERHSRRRLPLPLDAWNVARKRYETGRW